MAHRTTKNSDWNIKSTSGTGYSFDQAQLAVLMDIRDELQALNAKLNCYEVTEGFRSMKKMYEWQRRRWPKPRKH